MSEQPKDTKKKVAESGGTVEMVKGEVTRIRYRGKRKSIGENMYMSWVTAPAVTYHGRGDVTQLSALREQLNKGREKTDRVSVTALLIFMCAKALKQHPKLNSSLVDDNINIYSSCNIGMAVALDEGLIVPVIKHTDAKSLEEINVEVKTLSNKARSSKLTFDDITNGTFTISNLGTYRSIEYFTPIINLPEAAILGVGKTIETPVAINGGVEVRPIIGLSLTCDHRIIDGSVAAEFLQTLIDYIENPANLLQ